MAYARRASALILSRIMAVAEHHVHQEIASTITAAPGMQHMQRRWRRPTPSRGTPALIPAPHTPCIQVDRATPPQTSLRTRSWTSRSCGCPTPAHCRTATRSSTSSSPDTSATPTRQPIKPPPWPCTPHSCVCLLQPPHSRELRSRLTERLKELFPGRSTRHLLTRSSLMKLKVRTSTLLFTLSCCVCYCAHLCMSLMRLHHLQCHQYHPHTLSAG